MTASETMPATTEDGRTRRGNSTRRRLLAAAVELFATKGFEATTMKDLAAAAGVRAPAIYNHFSSKEAILAAAITWVLEDFHQLVVGADDTAQPTSERLELMVRRHVLYQLQHPTMAQASDLVLVSSFLRRLLPPDVQTRVRTLMREYVDRLTEVISQLDVSQLENTRRPNARLCALAVSNLCDRVGGWYRQDGPLTPEQVADAYWQLVQGMLRMPAT